MRRSFLTFLIACISIGGLHAQFIKEYYGVVGTAISFHSIVPANGTATSNLYISGSIANNIIIGEFGQNGNVIWSKSISVGDTGYIVNNMILDSDGKLVLTGTNYQTGDIYDDFSFVLKFDPSTQTVVWWKKLQAPISLFDVAEIGPGGDYVVCGQEVGLGDGIQVDHITLRVNRSTGDLSTISSLNANTNETAHALMVESASHDIYTTGRYELDPGGSNYFRICMDRLSGVVPVLDWTKYYIINLASTGRFYPQDIMQDGGSILIVGSGEDGGTGSLKYLYLIKTDLDGNTIWTNKYDITDAANDGLFSSIKKYDGGYIIAGSLWDGVLTNAFCFNVDESGNIQWANSYPYAIHSSLGLRMSGSLAVIGDHFYHVGELKTGDGSVHGVFTKGNVGSGEVGQCYSELTVEKIDFGTFSGDYTMDQGVVTVTAESPGILASTVAFSSEFSCLGTSVNDNVLHQFVETQLFPNPNIGVFQIEVSESNEVLHMELFSIEGQLVFSSILHSGTNTFQLMDLTSGIYTCHILDNDQKLINSISINKL